MKLFEYYEDSINLYAGVFSNHWKAQTFTVGTTGPSEDFKINDIELKLSRTGIPNTLRVFIQHTDDSGCPAGEILASGTIDGNSLTTAINGEWYKIEVSPHITLKAGVCYAIVLSAPDAPNSDNAVWCSGHFPGEYLGGSEFYSSDGGNSWTSADGDFLFRVYGIPPPLGSRQNINDLRIRVSGGAYIECPCSRWDQDNYSLIVETYLNKSQRDILRSNIRPGAVAEMYQLLGKPVYYDTSFGSNTIRLIPILGTQLAEMHSPKTIYVRNYAERITSANDFHIKIEGYISGSLV